MDVIDPEHPDHIPAAMGAMNGNHGKLECYACHAGWNVNFLGFHFYRNESLTQMDLISGRRTKGRVTTQEKVFASLKFEVPKPQVPPERWHSTHPRAVGRVVCIWWWIMVIPDSPAAVSGMTWSRMRVPSSPSTVPIVAKPVM